MWEIYTGGKQPYPAINNTDVVTKVRNFKGRKALHDVKIIIIALSSINKRLEIVFEAGVRNETDRDDSGAFVKRVKRAPNVLRAVFARARVKNKKNLPFYACRSW